MRRDIKKKDATGVEILAQKMLKTSDSQFSTDICCYEQGAKNLVSLRDFSGQTYYAKDFHQES